MGKTVPEGSLETIRIEVVQFLKPDGTIGWFVNHPRDGQPMSQMLGLLEMAKQEIYRRHVS